MAGARDVRFSSGLFNQSAHVIHDGLVVAHPQRGHDHADHRRFFGLLDQVVPGAHSACRGVHNLCPSSSTSGPGRPLPTSYSGPWPWTWRARLAPRPGRRRGIGDTPRSAARPCSAEQAHEAGQRQTLGRGPTRRMQAGRACVRTCHPSEPMKQTLHAARASSTTSSLASAPGSSRHTSNPPTNTVCAVGRSGETHAGEAAWRSLASQGGKRGSHRRSRGGSPLGERGRSWRGCGGGSIVRWSTGLGL